MADWDKFPEAFRAFGINFTEEPGWRTRGHGDMNSFNFLVIHHTASANNDASGIGPVTRGVAGLPGPLAQLCLKRNGDPHIIAQGVCWHAGYGNAMWGAPAGMGNYYSIGIEGIDSGRNTWTPEQRAMYPRVVAALLKYAGLPSDRWIFHRDYNKRDGKIDPVGFDWTWFRDEVNRHYNAGGQPPAPQKSEIQKCRDRNPWLGDKTSEGDELVLPIGDHGRAAFYKNGAVYFSAVTGAQAINPEILQKYGSMGYEGSFLGFPINSTHDLNTDGTLRAQAFEGGSIYWSKSNGAFVVNGRIGTKWASFNWEKGFLGMPITDEIVLPDKVGVLQAYQGGHIYHSPNTNAYAISGIIWDRFSKESYERGLGYPLSDQTNTPMKPGKFQIFEYAHVYSKEGTNRAFAVYYDFMEIYERMGYENSRLGFAISNKELVNGTSNTWKQHFEGGSIQINRDNKEIILFINGEQIAV